MGVYIYWKYVDLEQAKLEMGILEFKVGFSAKDPFERRSSLQTGNAKRLRLAVWDEEADRLCERGFRSFFPHSEADNEWRECADDESKQLILKFVEDSLAGKTSIVKFVYSRFAQKLAQEVRDEIGSETVESVKKSLGRRFGVGRSSPDRVVFPKPGGRSEPITSVSIPGGALSYFRSCPACGNKQFLELRQVKGVVYDQPKCCRGSKNEDESEAAQ